MPGAPDGPETAARGFHETTIRVRYQETDAQRRVHHANYLTYFEAARTEMLRARGFTYREFEESGLFLVVTELACSYRAPAEYDDLLTIRTWVEKAGGASLRHGYEVVRGTEILATGSTVLACVDSTGRVRRLPDRLRS